MKKRPKPVEEREPLKDDGETEEDALPEHNYIG